MVIMILHTRNWEKTLNTLIWPPNKNLSRMEGWSWITLCWIVWLWHVKINLVDTLFKKNKDHSLHQYPGMIICLLLMSLIQKDCKTCSCLFHMDNTCQWEEHSIEEVSVLASKEALPSSFACNISHKTAYIACKTCCWNESFSNHHQIIRYRCHGIGYLFPSRDSCTTDYSMSIIEKEKWKLVSIVSYMALSSQWHL